MATCVERLPMPVRSVGLGLPKEADRSGTHRLSQSRGTPATEAAV